MLKRYFTIGWRNLLSDYQSTLLNLIGLATGLASALFIWLWVSDELRVDKFHEKDKQLYQVMHVAGGTGGAHVFEMTPAPLAAALAKELPEVEYGVTVSAPNTRTGVLSNGEKRIRATEEYVSKDFFQVFSYPLLQGDKNTVLTDRTTVALSDELATKIFGTAENVVGKTVSWQNGNDSAVLRVGGVFKKPPLNSTAQFDLLLPYDVLLETTPNLGQWDYNDPNTYVVLKNGVDVGRFNKKISAYLQSKKSGPANEYLFVRRYSDKYLYANYENGVQSGGRIEYVRIFSLIAVFILVIACINFMNLSTAKASRRLKEVGIKKVVGASRTSLVLQYLGESMLLTVISFLLAMGLVLLLLPFFNTITGKQLALHPDGPFLSIASGMCLVTGLLAGSYPAFYISGFNPVTVLKGKLKTSLGEVWVRKGLVVFQFSLSVILIVGVMVVYRQVSYIRSKNLGFEKDNVIELKKDGLLNISVEPFLEAVRNMPGVTNAGMFAGDLINNISGTEISWPDMDPDDKVKFKYLFVADLFIQTLGIQLKEGQAFSSELGPDSTQIIFNEAAIAAMRLKDPIGKTVNQWGQHKRIVGVVKNFHFQSLYEEVKPCFLILSPASDLDNIAIKIQAGKEQQAIVAIQQYYKTYNPGFSFEFRFLDQNYQSLYESENRVALLSRYFAGIAILISCLGLFGLASFTAQRRQKEIGVRKVVGASAVSIALLLSRDFFKLVLLAIVIAFPVAGWLTTHWLSSFAYRIPMSADIFILAGAMTVLLTLVTISFQSINAALANPVKSLRSE